MLENTSFAFVANLLDVQCNLPFNVIENCYFQKANSIQIAQIKKYLSDSGYLYGLSKFNLSPYELVYIEDLSKPTQKSFKSQQLEEDWKYYILTFNGNNSIIYDLSLAANLAKVELEFGLQFIRHPESEGFGILKNPIHSFNYFHEMNTNSFLTEPAEYIDEKILQDIGSIYSNYKQLDETRYPDIKQAIQMLEDLKHIPNHSKFKVLGLFTIIEFLITHKPIDTGDSIIRQVTTKIPLLSKRFSEELDYSKFFGNTPQNTIWKKLYAYRSNIAHGGQSDFAKELSVLKDDLTVKKFLKLAVKMLLQHSLIEPQLYTDLREC
ncbi:hypothetical protein H6G06_16530 [Anabaena sphaerica FACHB-251]|uniref:Apea-like HEPN domain-containing protein n=1 Tax=Anabaena sphaerica FACHB-251 TaxID=2692883 RepID=A0A926WJ21_9NOST|nr:HEPN domain-containing protein [Anabaena sphaerica]MBD2295045.1 hypothetical protein [Anabaena sphaerica FACHB-251]